jgi:aminoglycoside phosphotransferase (APT) family kinase protein
MLPTDVTWANWADPFLKEEMWTPAVQMVLYRHGLSAGRIKAGYPGTNAVFVADDRYVVKFYPPMCRKDFEVESGVYRLLKGVGLPLPALLGTGILDSGIEWPYIVMSYCPGEAIRDAWPALSLAGKIHIAQALGRDIRQMHHTSVPPASPVYRTAAEWQSFANAHVAAVVDEIRAAGILSETTQVNLAVFLKEVAPAVIAAVEDVDLCLIDADLTEDHLLIRDDGQGWQVSALIDLADAEYAPREYEWIALWFGLLHREIEPARAFFHTYDSHLRIDEAFRRKAFVFTFIHRFAVDILKDCHAGIDRNRDYAADELLNMLWPPALTLS